MNWFRKKDINGGWMEALGMLLIGGLMSFVMIFINGLVIEICWNILFPTLFSFPEITYLQGCLLYVLFAVLFKGSLTYKSNNK